jgi:hypothetical protein
MNENSKYKGIEEEETNIPQWHIDIVRERLNDYRQNPDQGLNFRQVMDGLEKKFDV